MKRILVGGMHHESNTFNPIITGKKDFRVIYGEDIFNNIRENDSASGIITTLKGAGYEVVPTVFARAVPNGEVDYNFFQEIKSYMMNIAKSQRGKIDAITLALHGSMRVEGLGEAEGVILEELREIFPEIPIFVALDMHGTMTEKMHKNADGFVGYKQAPHTDCTETGVLAGKMTINALENGVLPKSAWIKIPMIIAGEKSGTDVEPMYSLIEKLREVEIEDQVLAASYLLGFPWADNSDSGVGVYVVAKDSQNRADELALKLAHEFWEMRGDFVFVTETYKPKEALEKALESAKEKDIPVYISDSGDNPTAGASSDNTEFLKLILENEDVKNLEKSLIYGGFYDPEATLLCRGKVGEKINLTFGSKFDKDSSTPITKEVLVKSYLANYKYANMFVGALALISIGNVDIVLSENHVGFTDPQMFRELGLSPEEHPIIVCKLGYLTPGHNALAKRSILALTKGNTNEDLETIDFKLIKRPIYPLEKDFHYDPKENFVVR